MNPYSTIRPPSVAEVVAWQRRPRKRIARVGRKKRRELAAESGFRAKVRERSGCFCEAARLLLPPGADAPMPCSLFRHQGHHAHHIWPEDRDASRHDPSRGLWLCFDAHRWVHDHPADAKLLGLLRAVR